MIRTTLAPGAPWPTVQVTSPQPVRGLLKLKAEKPKRETYTSRIVAYVIEHPGCTMQEASIDLHLTSNAAISLGLQQVKRGVLNSYKEEYKAQARYWVKGKMPKRFKKEN